MTGSTPSEPYVLGDTDLEHERLTRQAAIFNPLTERLLRDADIGLGQRILDIGSGVGDVAMLAAKMVGPTGEVVGADPDHSACLTGLLKS
jgi:ubiquinone/menaquinone biosynthesis C-methylase UbiE